MGDHVEVSGRMRHEACTLGQADGGATTTHTCEVAPPPPAAAKGPPGPAAQAWGWWLRT